MQRKAKVMLPFHLIATKASTFTLKTNHFVPKFWTNLYTNCFGPSAKVNTPSFEADDRPAAEREPAGRPISTRSPLFIEL
jgi:hypothetical protein